MTVRWRIIALAVASLVSIVAMIAVMAIGLSFAGHFVERIDAVHRRFEAIAELDGRAGAYGKHVTAALLQGRARMAEVTTARIDMERTFARLNRATRDEIATLGNVAAVESELGELENVRRMIELFHAIDAASTRAIALAQDGNNNEALAMFERDVEFRLTNELQPLIDNALADEREEVGLELAEIQRLQTAFLVGAGLLALLSFAVILVLGRMLYRNVMRAVLGLGRGAEAVARGDFSHRVDDSGSDEFAVIASAFNNMAAARAGERESLIKAGERLSGEVDARTLQLREANERLRAIDTRRGQFLADLSHELRTPLTVLRGEADVALRSADEGAELRQALERIRGQAAELGEFLDELIAFARTDVEIQQYTPAEIRLDEIVAAAVEEGEVLAEPREIAIVTELGDHGARVDADFRRMKQALMIGFDNAIKHSPPGGRITVSTAQGDGSAVIRIADQGPGVSEQDRPRVFERFYRGRGEGELFNKGLGIGLAIAKEIIERHGGTIGLDNGPEGGAVLTLTLKLAGEPA